jgi:hypothetical protein
MSVQRSAQPFFSVERNGCHVDLGINGIQAGRRHSEKGFLVANDLQVVRGSRANQNEDDA